MSLLPWESKLSCCEPIHVEWRTKKSLLLAGNQRMIIIDVTKEFYSQYYFNDILIKLIYLLRPFPQLESY